jgi:hypothetical protein
LLPIQITCVFEKFILRPDIFLNHSNSLPTLINNDQTGFIAGRYIGENIRLLFDIMEYAEENDIPGLFTMRLATNFLENVLICLPLVNL